MCCNSKITTDDDDGNDNDALCCIFFQNIYFLNIIKLAFIDRSINPAMFVVNPHNVSVIEVVVANVKN